MKRCFLMLLLVPCLCAAATKITDTQIDKSSMTNSTVNSTTIGAIAPAPANFSVSHVTGNTGSAISQGAWTMWNLEGFGNTNFVNQRGLGSGGFSWFNANNSGTIGSALMTLDGTGLLTMTKVLGTSSGAFGSVQVFSSSNPLSSQGSYLLWNVAGLGEMDLISQRGTGTGGFNWYNASGAGVLGSPLMTLTPAGTLITVGGFIGSLSGNVTGNVIGNASTASAFQAAPTTCSAGLVSIGVAANGNAQCQPWLNRFGWMQTATGSIPGGQYSTQGSYTAWNMAGVGDADFITNRGFGPGGFYFFNSDGSTNSVLAYIASDGSFNSSSGIFNTVTANTVTVNGTMSAQRIAASNIQSASSGGCTTGAGSYVTCSSTVTWPQSFGSTNYSASCMINGPVGHPSIMGYTKANQSITVTIQNGTADGAVVSGGGLDCIGHQN